MSSEATNKKQRGWAGEHLELIREQPTSQDLLPHVAVNLAQFRNEQIGVGYQAKHVIRQRSVPDTLAVTYDMTQHTVANTSKLTKRKPDVSDTLHTNPTRKPRLHNYLLCDGLRKFRKELASIESSI